MSALERLWKHTMSIFRYENVVVNNVTKNIKSLKYSGIKCHYSKGSLTEAGDSETPDLVNSYSIFCGLDADIKEGDEIVVTQQNDRQITLKVGEGFPYRTHQEFKVKRSDKA